MEIAGFDDLTANSLAFAKRFAREAGFHGVLRNVEAMGSRVSHETRVD
jgi:hypothetical protein